MEETAVAREALFHHHLQKPAERKDMCTVSKKLQCLGHQEGSLLKGLDSSTHHAQPFLTFGPMDGVPSRDPDCLSDTLGQRHRDSVPPLEGLIGVGRG